MEDKTEPEKCILDACCSGREMWYNKHHPNCIYMDIREEEKGILKFRPNFEIKPDIVGDFTNLPKEIKERNFKLIVWDVPHFKARKLTGEMLKKYGGLHPETWQSDLKKGFNELWSVLEDYGILIFKFSDYHIKFNKMMSLFPHKPLFYNYGNTSNKSTTKWFCFMKIPIAKSKTQGASPSFNKGLEVSATPSPKSPTATSPNPNYVLKNITGLLKVW